MPVYEILIPGFGDPDETKLLISRDFKEGTVEWRTAHLTLAALPTGSAKATGP